MSNTMIPSVRPLVTFAQSQTTTSPMQSLTPSPGNLTPLSLEATMLNSGVSGTIVSLPQTLCFSNSQIGNGSLASGIAVTPNSGSNGASTQLNAMSLGSVINVNPPSAMPQQFVQPLTVPQQQALNLPINHQPQQTPQQNFSVPHALTLGQVPPQSMSLVSQALPIGQVIGSSVAAPNLNFLNPTLFTVSSPGGQQNQYLSNPFPQFPIMLGNQQSIFTSLNTPNPLPTQSLDTPTLSQVSGVGPLPPIPQSQMISSLAVTSNQSSCNPLPLTQISNNPASLSSQPVSVFSFASPAMSIATPIKPAVKIGSQPSPDTTNTTQLSPVSHQSNTLVNINTTDTTNIVSSSTPTTSFLPVSLPPKVPETKSEIQAPDKTENSADKQPCSSGSSLPATGVGRARMKFTPIDPDDATPMKDPSYAHDEDSDVMDNGDEDDNSGPGWQDMGRRDSPEDHFQPGSIKLEPYDGPYKHDEDSSKHSNSPVDTKSDHLGETAIKTDTQGDLADVEDLEETEFVWEDYLRETGATAVPPTAFKHVEMSLQSGFSKGMKLEAPNKHNPTSYWVATIVMTCGPLLRLRYEGYHDNSSADFWSDPMTSDIHPLGWCEENGKSLQPLEVIKEKYPDWQKFLSESLRGASTAPSYLLDKSTGATPIDQIREGMRLEIQDELRPNQLWFVKIMENIGGRLFLRYEGLESTSNDFWLFYLDDRLHPIGWCKTVGYQYIAPSVVKNGSGKSEEQLKDLVGSITDIFNQKLPADIFNDQGKIEPHEFAVGMKLEAVDPTNRDSICPATVVEVVDSNYFIVEIDDLRDVNTAKKIQFCCHGNTPTIFPVNWTASKGIKMAPPPGWSETEFRWREYLKSCSATAAPAEIFNLNVTEHEFECGMKLEAVKPSQPSQICAATITKIVEHLMWIHLDSSKRMMDSHVESIHSLNLFPIGWCVSNGYQLKPPGKLSGGYSGRRRIAVVQPEMAETQKTEPQVHSSTGRELFGGPQIYFNHRCFSGPYLSKGRIAELPRSVGPGPVTLVMKEVLSKLINTAYKSCRVLRELQLEGKPNPDMTQQMLKAKYKGKSYRAVVEICRTASQLEEFCRQVCIKLECCPNLISPHFVNGSCPENCAQLTKTRYTYYYGKRKKKIGRPPGGHSNLENGQRKPGKRKKRKKIGMMSKRSSRPTVDEQGDNVDDDKASVCSDTKTVDSTSTSGSKDRGEGKAMKDANSSYNNFGIKRRYTHHIPPPSEIRTRGAKLPKYSFEKRTHKKIMIVEGSQQSIKTRKETLKSSPVPREAQTMIESSFSTSRPDMPVTLKSEPPLKLDKNPLEWTVSEVGQFLQTTDCGDRELVSKLRTEEIDGQALLLLTLPNIQEYMGIKLGPAIKLCHLIERIKIAFYEHFAK